MTPNEDKINNTAQKVGCSVDDLVSLGDEFGMTADNLGDMFSSFDRNMNRVKLLGPVASTLCAAVKISFSGLSRGGREVKGAVCIVFGGEERDFINELCRISYGTLPSGFSACEKWRTFRAKATQLSDASDKTLEGRLRPLLQHAFTKENLTCLLNARSKEQINKLRQDFQTAIKMQALPSTITYELEVEFFDESDIENMELELDLDDESLREKGDVCLPCDVEIGAVNGRAAKHIMPGDYVWLKLEDGPGLKGLVFHMLKSIDIDPVYRVDEIKRTEDNSLAFYFTICRGVRGKVKVSPNTLIKAGVIQISAGQEKKKSGLAHKFFDLLS